MSTVTESETDSNGVLSSNGWGWLGFALVALPLFGLGATGGGVNMAGLAGTAIGSGTYLIFYLVAKVVTKVRG